MAWDSKTSRRRQTSNASNKPNRYSSSVPASTATVTLNKPKSTHVADPNLQPFLSSSFDPAEYLNVTLPPLRSSTAASAGAAVPLTDLSTETQTLLSQLSAHTTRLTSTLTQLTDEILRSGSRLAYEVEVLRGETLGLSEALTEGLQDDISKFVKGGLNQDIENKSLSAGDQNGARRSSTAAAPLKASPKIESASIVDPPYITQLRTLTLVRSRLETVIKTFGDAMAWTFPPSEVSVTSSFLSVSAPEPGSEMHSVEEKGQEVSQKLRNEIADLLIGEDPIDGIEAAAKRVEELKDLAIVWRGTAEEKARVRFVESLAKLVEDKHRELLRDAENNDQLRQRVETLQETVASEEATSHGSGYGFISQLQKFRGS